MKHASATRSAGANKVIAGYQPAGARCGIVCIAAILSLAILFVYAKFRNTSTVPRVFVSGLACPHGVRWSMSMHREHQVLESEAGVLWAALWGGAGGGGVGGVCV